MPSRMGSEFRTPSSGRAREAGRRRDVVQGIVGHQFVDHRGAGRADFGGLLPAPRRGLHEERHLLLSYLESDLLGDQLRYGLAGS
jgi:hypothetical protein